MGTRISLIPNENVLKLYVTVAQSCEYTENHWIAHFIQMNRTVYILFFNKAVFLKQDEIYFFTFTIDETNVTKLKSSSSYFLTRQNEGVSQLTQLLKAET